MTAYRAFIALELDRHTAIAIALILLCSAEMYINSYDILRGLDTEFGYESYESYYEYKEMLTPLTAKTSRDKDGFFRVGVTFGRSKNDAIGFGYNGLTHYSSNYDKQVNSLIKNLGMAQAWYFSAYFGSTMLTDSILSVRYIISDLPAPPIYRPIKTSGLYTLYHNPDAVSIGIAVNKQSLYDFSFGANPFDSQNRLIRALTGIDADCFVPVYFSKTDLEGSSRYTLTSEGMPIYACFSGNKRKGNLNVNGRNLGELFTNDSNRIHYIGSFNKNENVNIVVNRNNISEKIYRLDMTVYERAMNILKASQLRVEHYNNKSISGSITAKYEDMLFTSIPYDKGWSVQVNGEKILPEKFAGSLIAIPLDEGENKIKMTYSAGGSTVGICISVAMLVLILLGSRFSLKIVG